MVAVEKDIRAFRKVDCCIIPLSVMASVAVVKSHVQKQCGEERGYVIYICSPSSREIRVKIQNRNLETGTDPEAIEKCSLLAFFLRLV